MGADSARRERMPERRTRVDRRRAGVQEERRLRSIIERLADGIVIVGADGAIRFANPAAERLFARSAQSLVGTPFGFPIASDDPAEIELVRPDGEPVAAELRVVEIDWYAEPAHLVSIRDITDRRHAEERARQVERERAARAEAEVANQAKSVFLATMSHELRTPLNAVIGYAQLLDLEIGGTLSPEQHRHVDRILASSEHLLGLVSEVLDLAKVDADRLTVAIATVPAATTADAAVALVHPAAEARGVRLTAATEPGEGEALCYEGDENRVRQILVNLLTNAVKFTDAGGTVSLACGRTTRPHPEARLEPGGVFTHFSVRDTGIGIPAEQLARIFEPFVQVVSGHTRSNDGSGLGLAISRRLARLMHGDITVRSTVGEGSTFVLWLPYAEPEPQEGSSRDGASSVASAHPHGFAGIGEILLRELPSLLEAFVARLRAECPTAAAADLRFSQLADHVASYLADVAGLLIALEEAGGQPSSALGDATEIHRVVAVRHGSQRARLGWTVDAIRCEYRILREEIERAVRERGAAPAAAAVDGALAVVGRLIGQAERLSVRTLARITGPEEDARESPGGP
jgi:PAS domain S-box-containing protein